MFQGSVYGRLGAQPKEHQTKNDKVMATANIAVDVTPYNSDQDETLWISILAFGNIAKQLLRHDVGDLISAMGQLTQSWWKDSSGVEKVGYSLKADCIISARTIRPPGGKKRTECSPASDHKQFSEED